MLVLVAALTNGLTGPLAHGHLLMGTPGQHENGQHEMGMPQGAAAAEPEHAEDCDGTEEGSQASYQSGDHSHGKASGAVPLVCGAGGSCCASVAIAEVSFAVASIPIGQPVTLPSPLIGLAPPVGERPPLSLHV